VLVNSKHNSAHCEFTVQDSELLRYRDTEGQNHWQAFKILKIV